MCSSDLLRPQVKIKVGRLFHTGATEIIVGSSIAARFANTGIGQKLRFAQREWTIVGVFDAKGSAAESELWADAKLIQDVYRRGNSYQSMLVRLDSPASFETFKVALTTNPQLNVQVRRETDYYAAQSETMTALIKGIGYTIAVLMGMGDRKSTRLNSSH